MLVQGAKEAWWLLLIKAGNLVGERCLGCLHGAREAKQTQCFGQVDGHASKRRDLRFTAALQSVALAHEGRSVCWEGLGVSKRGCRASNAECRKCFGRPALEHIHSWSGWCGVNELGHTRCVGRLLQQCRDIRV